MRLSISVTDYSWAGGPEAFAGELTRIAGEADEAGLHTLWVADHLLQADPTSTPEAPMLEAYTTLGYLAARTERVRLGTMVSAVTYRAPALLIKAVTTLDVLSGGRAWLGIGAGYQEMESQAMGLNLPGVRERYEHLEDTLHLARRMWAGEKAPFEGTRLWLDYPVGSPRPVSRPGPRVLIGGMGERRTLRLVAEHADACNLFDIPDGGATIRRKLAVLARHCEAAERPYEAIEKTASTRLEAGEDAESLAERCEGLAALGIEHVVLVNAGPWTPRAMDAVAGAVPVVDAIRTCTELEPC
jgi:F420-dependent oxidoreductase-like protein